MKKFVLMLSVLLGSCSLSMAQTSATDTASVEAIDKIDDNSTMNAMNDSAQAAQQDTVAAQQEEPAAAPAQEPVDDSGPNMLVMGVLTLCGIIGIILGVVAIVKVKRAKEERDEEIAALKTALQHRKAEHDEEIKRLQIRVAALETNTAQPAAPASHKVNQEKKVVSETVSDVPAAAPVQVYLTRPDDHGYFIAETKRLERGNSIFVLTTTDGVHGTYRVIDDPGVHQLALMMPTENLTRACIGEGIQVSNGKSRIVTDKPGVAVKEAGRWHVVNPAEIHYED